MNQSNAVKYQAISLSLQNMCVQYSINPLILNITSL